MTSSVPVVQVRGVSKSFGPKVALNDVSFAVPSGEIFGLLGPNGAGKTTLFRLLMGILKATSGQLLLNGQDAFDDRVETKRLVGYLPDEPAFYSYLSGREVLELSARMHGLPVELTLDRVLPWVEFFRLSDALDQYAEDYSRGMKKKLGLVLAMLHEPQLLIVDEPTSGLDLESTRLFYELMRRQAAEGTTIVFSTHLMDQVSRLCHSAAILKQGQLVAVGTVDNLREGLGESATVEEVYLHYTSDAAPCPNSPA